jgi:thiamine pyrophosphokinase
MRTVLVVASGPGVPRDVVSPDAVAVIAADGGAAAGYVVDLAVGDFDSLPPELLAAMPRVERHPAAKDATDLELALDAALRLEPERILVVGSAGGRLDHLLGSLLLLAADAYAGVQVDAQLGRAAVHVVRGERRLRGRVGELVSLFALHGPATGVVTDGLAYPLRGETLPPGTSRGTSNVFAAEEALVSVGGGVVVALRPTGSVEGGTAS